MAKWKWSIAEMRETEVAHLRGNLKIAMEALEELAQAGDETAQRALERIEGNEKPLQNEEAKENPCS